MVLLLDYSRPFNHLQNCLIVKGNLIVAGRKGPDLFWNLSLFEIEKMFYTSFWKLGDSVFTSKKFHQVMSVDFKIINRLAFHLPSNKANNNFQAKYLCKIYLHLVLGSTWHKETTWVLRNCFWNILDCLYIHCHQNNHQHWLHKVFPQSICWRLF